MKPNKKQIETLREFMRMGGGCLASSEWTNGSGRYVTKRQPPVFCERLPIERAIKLRGLSGILARALHAERPRVSSVVIVVNRRRVRSLLRSPTRKIKRGWYFSERHGLHILEAPTYDLRPDRAPRTRALDWVAVESEADARKIWHGARFEMYASSPDKVDEGEIVAVDNSKSALVDLLDRQYPAGWSEVAK